jgi:hypothetical protein
MAKCLQIGGYQRAGPNPARPIRKSPHLCVSGGPTGVSVGVSKGPVSTWASPRLPAAAKLQQLWHATVSLEVVRDPHQH